MVLENTFELEITHDTTMSGKTTTTEASIPLVFARLDLPTAVASPIAVATTTTPTRNNSMDLPLCDRPTMNANSPQTPPLHSSRCGGRCVCIRLPENDDTTSELPEETIQKLLKQGYTRGLTESLGRNRMEFPLAIWIVDNSASMKETDGRRIATCRYSTKTRFVPCTRWEEMQQTVEYHADMAAMLQSPTIFR